MPLDVADIIAVIRDIALISILLFAMAVLLALYWKLSGVLDSARRIMKNADEVADAISSRIVGPAAAGSGVAFGAGKVAAFILGLSRRKKGGKSDG